MTSGKEGWIESSTSLPCLLRHMKNWEGVMIAMVAMSWKAIEHLCEKCLLSLGDILFCETKLKGLWSDNLVQFSFSYKVYQLRPSDPDGVFFLYHFLGIYDFFGDLKNFFPVENLRIQNIDPYRKCLLYFINT